MDIFPDTLMLYLKKSPVEYGKWRVWKILQKEMKKKPFSRGMYKTTPGFSIELDPDQYISQFIYCWGVWEPDESYVISNYLSPGDTFVDVGANTGYFTLLASQTVGPAGRVHAIEPVPVTADALRKNLAANHVTNVTVHECAATTEVSTVRINRHGFGDISGMNSLRAPAHDRAYWEVPSLPLDQILARVDDIRLMKIDVEGAELLALQGATRILDSTRAPIVLCEITDKFIRQVAGSAEEVYRFMAERGYAYAYDCHNRQLKRLSPADRASDLLQRNIVFSKTSL